MPLLEREFGLIGRRFVEALAKSLPDADIDELRWRFHFVIGAMTQLLNFDRSTTMPANARGRRIGTSELLAFAVAGICQRAPDNEKERR